MSKLFDKFRVSSPAANYRKRLYDYRRVVLLILKLMLAFLAAVSVGSLIAEYGFYIDEDIKKITSKMPGYVLVALAVYYLLRTVLEIDRKKFVKTHRVELFLVGIIILYLLLPKVIEKLLLSINPLLLPETIAYVYLITTQILALVALGVEALNQTKKILYLNIQPSVLLMLSFFVIIALGTLLLMMPKSTVNGSINFIDALFTATSAVTVTGLVTLNTQSFFSTTGQVIILFLIQIGGLGIMTLTSFFAMSSGKSYNLKEYIAIQEILGEENISSIKKFIITIITTTFIIEVLGAVFIVYSGSVDFIKSPVDKIFFAVFHSVSAFCNAGFSLYGQNLAHHSLSLNVPFLSVVMFLIVVGGIGFPVLNDVGTNVLKRISGKRMKFRIHSKLVLLSSGILLFVGAFLFFAIEYNNILKENSIGEKLISALFHSVSTRTAGFNAVNVPDLSLATIFIMIALMWIGASPGSAGGGIKTTAFSLSLLNLYSIARGKPNVEIFKRQISSRDISKAFSTIIISMVYITMAVFLLTLTEPFEFEEILFEVISAASTVGLSEGITPYLSTTGKAIIIITMFIGRIGFLTFTFALFRSREIHNYDYVEEKIII